MLNSITTTGRYGLIIEILQIDRYAEKPTVAKVCRHLQRKNDPLRTGRFPMGLHLWQTVERAGRP
jgi:hypothetical protein